MLQSNVTIYDIMYLLTLIIIAAGLYGCYMWGKRDGYIEGCKVRRLADRQVRRLSK